MRDQVLVLAQQGDGMYEIAKRLDLDTRQVRGAIIAARSRGINVPASADQPRNKSIPAMPSTPQGAPLAPVAVSISGPASPAPVTSASVPATTTIPQESSPPLPQDGFMSSRSSTAYGFLGSGQTLKYLVERIVPPDGFMGSHAAPFSVEDLGRLYGEGTYKIVRQESGKYPFELPPQVIGPAFGQSRYPGSKTEADPKRDDLAVTLRRLYGDAAGSPAALYGRPAAPSDPLGTSEAIRQLGESNRHAMEQIEKERNAGPNTHIQQFYAQQQAAAEKSREDERRREDERNHKDQEEYRRRQDDDRIRHERELEKIKLENESKLRYEAETRKTLLELEGRKMDMFREELRLREDSNNKELARTREEMKELKESVSEEMDRERESLQREHELRLGALNKEHELNSQILEIKKNAIESGNGDIFLSTFEKVVAEVGKQVGAIVELKKMEAMSPEAQAAAINQSTSRNKASVDGNYKEEPKKEEPAPHGKGNGNGNGAGKSSDPMRSENMEQIVREFLGKPELHGVIREWVRQVRLGTTPAMFANMYVEFMRDPEDHKLRKSTNSFANFMASRGWPEMLEVLKPSLEKDELAVFETPAAADFYETFRACIVETVNAYWTQFMADREASKDRMRAISTPVASPEPVEAAK